MKQALSDVSDSQQETILASLKILNKILLENTSKDSDNN